MNDPNGSARKYIGQLAKRSIQARSFCYELAWLAAEQPLGTGSEMLERLISSARGSSSPTTLPPLAASATRGTLFSWLIHTRMAVGCCCRERAKMNEQLLATRGVRADSGSGGYAESTEGRPAWVAILILDQEYLTRL
eukprot:6178575-Pleurochrysis_carterae.AAC.2